MKENSGILVALGYLIGFTTAFIAFGLQPQSSAPAPLAKVDYSRNLQSQKVTDNKQVAAVVSAIKTEEGLVANIDGENRLISAKSIEQADGEFGFHYEVHAVAVSPDEQYVHFCEQAREIPTECRHYLYDIKNDVVRRVKLDNIQLVSQISNLDVNWQSDNKLVVNKFESVDAAKPWQLK